MASWNQILSEVQSVSPLDDLRGKAIADLSSYRGRNTICYYSGWLQGSSSEGVSICDDDMNGLMNAMYKLDRSKGLDLVLHTPGGDLAATEAIVKYIRDCFGNNVVAIVPQLAMSAGTMIACSCKEIIMGRQSSLGPTDPQFGGVAAGGVIEEFETAVREVEKNPSSAELWGKIIGKYHPTFLGDCVKAVDMSRDIVGKWLSSNMLEDDLSLEAKLEGILSLLCDHRESAMHNRHFSHDDLEEIGMKITMMEHDNELQDRILTLHHAFMVTFQKTGAIKMIESSNCSRWIISSNS
jgi:ATP-dependent protease ClpP protease subunit